MPEPLHDTLARLHVELEKAGPIDAKLRADLERTIAEMRDLVERDRAALGPAHPLGEQLEELAVRFEQSHPHLTEAIGRVVQALGAMGI
jgi:uncharacterized protein DUF4404